MTRITVNEPAIERFFEKRAFAGAAIPGLGSSAQRLADRMVEQAQKNARGGIVRSRTDELALSMHAIVRVNAKTGGLEIGVGSTAPHADYIENGARAHQIRAKNAGMLRSEPGHPDPLHRFGLKRVNHPGNRPFHVMRSAVLSVLGRGGV